MIPMINMKRQFEEIRAEVMPLIAEVLESSRYVLGPKGAELEQVIAAYTGVKHAIGVASGTDALHLALKAAGVCAGDEVITTPFTFFATAEAIMYLGAKPVFVDIEDDTLNIDPKKIIEKITPKTRAILPVHIFGHPADMTLIEEIAKKYDLRVIEDCAQSFGADYHGRKTGSFGEAGCFSFYPSKNLGAAGDAGLITLNDKAMLDEIKTLRNHGSSRLYVHDEIGYNSRLDEIQAAILLVKMKRIDAYNEARRQKAAMYTERLSGKVGCPVERQGCKHVYHQYTIRSAHRDKIQAALHDGGVTSNVYYPIPLHLQGATSYLGYKTGSLPVAERAAREVLSLPICPYTEESAIALAAKIIGSV